MRQTEIADEISLVATGHFDALLIEQFIAKFFSLSSGAPLIIDYILHISTDEGDELELGFFTAKRIVDITLSNGKIYCCSYPVTAITNVALVDRGTKSTLTIAGERKFDYNVVKPGAIDGIEKYRQSLQHQITFAKTAANS